MIVLLIQILMGIAFGAMIGREPERAFWEKLGTSCAFMAAFFSFSLDTAGATIAERISLILLVIVPFLYGVVEGVRVRQNHYRKKGR